MVTSLLLFRRVSQMKTLGAQTYEKGQCLANLVIEIWMINISLVWKGDALAYIKSSKCEKRPVLPCLAFLRSQVQSRVGCGGY